MPEPTKPSLDEKLKAAQEKADTIKSVADANAHLDAVEKYLFAKDEKGVSIYEGKHGYNPFLFKAQQITPLRERLNNGEESEELFKAVGLVKQVPPDGKALKISSMLVTERRTLKGELKTDV